MTDKQIKTLNQAIQTYGKNSQVDKAIEEMSELTKELLKERQNKGSAEHIMEELADVIIMMYQLMMIFNIADFDHCIDYKIKRLARRLNNNGGD